MTSVDASRRGRPLLTDRLVARALVMAMDTAVPTSTAARELIVVGRGSSKALERALANIVSRPAGRPSRTATRAALFLSAALERLAGVDAAAGTDVVSSANPSVQAASTHDAT